MALFVRKGGSRHTGQAAPPQRNIHDEKPISARQCIKSLAQIGKSKDKYIPSILEAFQNADLSKYKDSMRPLIEKDIEEVKNILTA